ncbi:heavy metal-binding domain-containing protein [Emticicia sp. W12TSBA100-4]|uniref:heavy metal-binding domain-containing protein n=1 Tax=Emticicia sp. W12TSBA100-4 TaxID=3160965 RepID=UPI003305DCBF
MENCPNCNESFKGFMNSNKLLKEETVEFINHYLPPEEHKTHYCEKCGYDKYYSAKDKYNDAVNRISKFQMNNIDFVPCISIQEPRSWDIEVIGLVTAQSTMGTGFYTEIASSWGDFIGADSKSMNAKVSTGESNCLNILRTKAISMGGNAVVGVDIDYAEVGSLKGMILVCATGTAVRLKNLDVLPIENKEQIAQLIEVSEEMKMIGKFSKVQL